jgi:hypothetical protein
LKITSTDNDKVSGSSWINVVQNNDKEKPSNRRGHSMLYHKATLILYGGIGTDGKLVDDNIYRYTIETKSWNIIGLSGFKPGSRSFHTMNFLKSDSIIIFGGKTIKDNDILANNDLVYIDLNNWDCSTPFIANVGPSPRFSHSCSYSSNHNPNEHILIGGLDKTFCPFTIFLIKEINITEDKKWVFEHKKVRSNISMESKADIYETAKKTIISFKKQIESLELQLIQVNKK